jgi:hypothetical protein
MKTIEKILYSIGRDPMPFWVGWLSAVIGMSLGFVIGEIFF